ncbi:MiaB/RimO family radical SAM methylthiotransferase [Candidatus Collierbacteria bacterium]|nr:MiaB/RimO family radical SAM methylthiotransferase [Candidatus Collierbacteria bacterium]
MGKTYFIKTFGCQANKSDSERIEGDYQARGYKKSASWRKADEIIVNTCAVRERAEHRARGFIHNVVSYFEMNRSAALLQSSFRPPAQAAGVTGEAGQPVRIRPKIILTGCMTHHGEKKLLEMIPELDQVLPINEVGFNQSSIRRDKIHAWVPISEGCNSFCTFCIVPYSRGREKSRPMEDILKEVEDLAKQGYRKITLLGQNVNSYGLERIGIGYRKLLLNNNFTRSKIPPNQSQYIKPKGIPPFVKLLKEISKIREIEKIGFLTSNPWDFYDELIEEIAGNTKIDRFIHLPVQSGSDRILKLMNRGYTRQDYLGLILRLRKAVPDVVIGTDIIVGFPTETNEDFKQTVDLAKKADLTVAFMAQYSPRPGTAAWRIYKDDVPAEVKKKRWLILEKLINRKNLDKRPVFYE